MEINEKFEQLISKLYSISGNEVVERINEIDLERQVTAVFTTFNRAESLKWAVQSVIDSPVARASNVLNEVIIVDDMSTDPGVDDTLQELKENYGSMVRIIRPGSKLFCFGAWDVGIESVEGSKYIMIGDDDSLVNQNWPAKLLVFELLKQEGIHTSALMGPIYFRSTVPSGVVPKKEIGGINFKGISSNFDKLPRGCLSNPKFLDKELRLLFPYEISNLAGNIMLERDDLLSVGGFNGDGEIELNYGGETNLAMKLSDLKSPTKIPLVFCPSPSMACVHLRVGYQQENLDGDLRYASQFGMTQSELEEMIEFSNKPNLNTGNRRDPNVWLYLRTRNFTRLAKRKGALQFLIQINRALREAITDDTSYYQNQMPFSDRMNAVLTGIVNGYLGKTMYV